MQRSYFSLRRLKKKRGKSISVIWKKKKRRGRGLYKYYNSNERRETLISYLKDLCDLLLSLWIFDYPFPVAAFLRVFNSPSLPPPPPPTKKKQMSIFLFCWNTRMKQNTHLSISGYRIETSGSNHWRTTTTNRWINKSERRQALVGKWTNDEGRWWTGKRLYKAVQNYNNNGFLKLL